MSIHHILVTGANSGIGLALCKMLATHPTHNCHVYLGSRSSTKGAAACKSITDAFPEVVGKIEAITIDVTDEDSIDLAVTSLQSRGIKLYALMNNAGIGLGTNAGGVDGVLKTNYYGPMLVTEKCVALLEENGRIVNTGSGSASMYLRSQSADVQKIFSSKTTTIKELTAAVENLKGAATMGGYGLSKAALTSLTIIHGVMYPYLKVVSLSPGFIQTNMTAGFGAKLTPEQGCVSMIKCLFDKVESGWYYGSDGLRSPLIESRDPGEPEYRG